MHRPRGIHHQRTSLCANPYPFLGTTASLGASLATRPAEVRLECRPEPESPPAHRLLADAQQLRRPLAAQPEEVLPLCHGASPRVKTADVGDGREALLMVRRVWVNWIAAAQIWRPVVAGRPITHRAVGAPGSEELGTESAHGKPSSAELLYGVDGSNSVS